MSIEYTNGFPSFFSQVPTLKMRDPLAQFLGAAEGGVMEYHYADAVRLAGHSCPTVAGAYMMVLKGLKALYGDETPERGGVKVLFANARDEGTTGVVASVATLLTGAATEMGFGGIGPARRFARRNLLTFDQPIHATMVLRRNDTGKTIELTLNLDDVVPWSEEARQLLPKAVGGAANEAELARFAECWQERVRKILVDFADDARLVTVKV